jgi:GntR family transcriptional regulator
VLPSVRQIASYLAVNPMTVSRAIQQLVEQGWLERRRGQPTQVAESVNNHASAEALLQPQLAVLLASAQQLGLSKQQIIDLIEKQWDRLKSTET